MTRLFPCTRLQAALLAAIAGVLVVLPAGAGAATIHVDSKSNAPAAACGSDTEPCETIADAMARASAGDVLDLAPGDYLGATIDKPVQLRGAQAGVSGTARGIGKATRTSTVRSTLVIQATVTLDGLEFRGVRGGPALHLAATLPSGGAGSVLVRNSTFSGIGGTQVVHADADIDELEFTDNLFTSEPGFAHTALFVHGELVPGGIEDVLVERNEFRGFTGHVDAAVIDAGGVPGMRVRTNTLVNSGPLLVLSDTDGSIARVLVQDNVGTSFTGHGIRLGGGLEGVTIERNRMAGGTVAVRLTDERGSGPSRDLVVRANDISGFGTAVEASGDSIAGALELHGNRIALATQDGVIVNSTTGGSIDARRNWWGRSAGLPASAFDGTVDASEPLRLVGVEAPGAVLVGGSGVVSVRLVGAVGSGAESEAAGFPVTFATTNARLDATSVTIAFGTASTLFTAGTAAGSTTTSATLDGETVSATTRILAAGSEVPPGPALPSVADGQVGIASGFVARVRLRTALLSRALSEGITQFVTSNRPASVCTTVYVSHYTAKLLGLRPRTSPTHEPFIIGKSRTRAVTGARSVTTMIRRRPRFAITRYDERVEAFVVTHVRTRGGATRTTHRRFVIPARVH